jgi:dihydrofolate reductase
MTVTPTTVSLIAAADKNLCIGYKNNLPWDGPMKSDMSHFVSVTTGKSVIMGRKTIESIGKPLKNRKNIVLSRNPDFCMEGVTVVSTIEQAIEEAGQGEVMVIGGEEIYKLFMPLCDRIYLTMADIKVGLGDAYFPAIDNKQWAIVDEEQHYADEKNYADYSFLIYEKVA